MFHKCVTVSLALLVYDADADSTAVEQLKPPRRQEQDELRQNQLININQNWYKVGYFLLSLTTPRPNYNTKCPAARFLLYDYCKNNISEYCIQLFYKHSSDTQFKETE